MYSHTDLTLCVLVIDLLATFLIVSKEFLSQFVANEITQEVAFGISADFLQEGCHISWPVACYLCKKNYIIEPCYNLAFSTFNTI